MCIIWDVRSKQNAILATSSWDHGSGLSKVCVPLASRWCTPSANHGIAAPVCQSLYSCVGALARAQRVEDKRGHPRDHRRLQDLVRVVENIPFWLFDAEFRPRLLEAHGVLLAIMVAPWGLGKETTFAGDRDALITIVRGDRDQSNPGFAAVWHLDTWRCAKVQTRHKKDPSITSVYQSKPNKHTHTHTEITGPWFTH